MYQQHQTGHDGEHLATNYLKEKGYNILDTNFFVRWGEIDIIAQKNNTIYFFEVKTRKTLRYGHPFHAISRRKIQKIKGVASVYLSRHSLSYQALAVGVIGIIMLPNKPVTIECLPQVI
ncbi:MAG: YraN family protein [Patescibacteria group bacterium]|jgi:putative endonuclease